MVQFKKYKDPSATRFSNPVSISEGIEKFLSAYKLENKFLQTLVSTKWESLVGISVASRTEKIFFKEKTMYVVLNSASLKHQMNLSKSKVVALVNNEMHQTIVDDVVFL